MLSGLYIHILYKDFTPVGGTPASDLCIVTHDSVSRGRREWIPCLPEVAHLVKDILLSPSLWMSVTAKAARKSASKLTFTPEHCGQLDFFSACRPHRFSS